NTITSSSQSPQTSELIDHFRTSRIGPTSSTLYNLDNAVLDQGMLRFDVPVRGNASEAFAYFGSHRTADVYSAKIDNGIASFTIPIPDSQASPGKLNVIAGHYTERGAQWTSSWRFDISDVQEIADAGTTETQSTDAKTRKTETTYTGVNETDSVNENNLPSERFNTFVQEDSGNNKDIRITASISDPPKQDIAHPVVDGQYFLMVNEHYQKVSLFRLDSSGDYSFIEAKNLTEDAVFSYSGLNAKVVSFNSTQTSTSKLEETLKSAHSTQNSMNTLIEENPNNTNNLLPQYQRYSSGIIHDDMGQWLYAERLNTDKTISELSRDFSDRYKIGDPERGISQYAFYKTIDDYAAQNNLEKARKISRSVHA
ncbi:MAG: hypothetical protein KKE20_03800, partial [Nanoarchaeota archaeon]|nr:hypothetical protein [Nanoarchaeota archaeon]